MTQQSSQYEIITISSEDSEEINTQQKEHFEDNQNNQNSTKSIRRTN